MALIPRALFSSLHFRPKKKWSVPSAFWLVLKKHIYLSINIKRSVLLIKEDLPSKKRTESAQRPSKLKLNDKTK